MRRFGFAAVILVAPMVGAAPLPIGTPVPDRCGLEAVGGAVAAAMKARVPVVALLEDNADGTIPLLDNDFAGQEANARREDRDVYSGSSALRVGVLQPNLVYQKFHARIAGWAYPIRENPKPGEYRFVRFAWKKVGGQGMMIQFHDSGGTKGWGQRYLAGVPNVDWASLKIADAPPADWEVVTRDLFQDFGAFTLSGVAFSPLDGEAGLFDHVYLGRSIADLDRVSAWSRNRDVPAERLSADQLERAWTDLAAGDEAEAARAMRRLVAGRAEAVPFVRDRLKPHDPTERERVLLRLIVDLDADRFAVREKAFKALEKAGSEARPLLERALRQNPSAEVASRIRRLLGDRATEVGEESLRLVRVVRVLEASATPPAKQLLKELADGQLATVALDARAALKRLGP